MVEQTLTVTTPQTEPSGSRKKNGYTTELVIAGVVILWFLALFVGQRLSIDLALPSGIALMALLAFCNHAIGLSLTPQRQLLALYRRVRDAIRARLESELLTPAL